MNKKDFFIWFNPPKDIVDWVIVILLSPLAYILLLLGLAIQKVGSKTGLVKT